MINKFDMVIIDFGDHIFQIVEMHHHTYASTSIIQKLLHCAILHLILENLEDNSSNNLSALILHRRGHKRKAELEYHYLH